MRRAFVLLLAVLIAFTLPSCGKKNDYPFWCELTLPLPDTFSSVEVEEFDAAFTDGRAVVGINRISYDVSEDLGIAVTLEPGQFAHYYMLLSGREYEIKEEGDVPYYSYENDGYFYTFTFYASKYAYFTVMYSCGSLLRGEYEAKFIKYASEAYFTM